MNKNLKFFFIALLGSIIFGGGVNVLADGLEDFLFSEVYHQPSQLFLAQVSPRTLQSFKEEIPEIEAKSAISVKIDKTGREWIIFEKNPDEILPIASLTKLMTALVSLRYYASFQVVEISKEAVGQPEDFGQLKIGESLSVEDLLYITLIESSNDSAYALSELISKEAFVDLMNIEVGHLGLKDTHFIDPTGYDPENHSTARSLAKFSQYLLDQRPEIWEITTYLEFELYDPDGIFHHQLLNTNEILGEFPEIIGGKTGYTPEAKGCLILLLRDKNTANILINVVLGSENRFEDMRKLIDHAF